ncbi:hypothetical protein FRC12_011214 [Ceratobasidium sp. 428]|nr:hypothetical protein FRC12_011214 [Ceratobasidium sp. 428]
MLKDVLNALDCELPGLAPNIQQLGSTNKCLKLLRNKCPTAIPINMLPAELLTKIFELLCCSYEELDKTDQPFRFPWTLAWVNTYWRQLAVGNSRLWTHIHILVTLSKRHGKLNEQAQAQLKYARRLSLDVMLDATRYLAPAKDNFLITVVPRLRSLAYRSGFSDTCLPSAALSPWFRQGTPGTCYCLKLQSDGSVQRGDLRLNIRSPSTSLKRIEAFLAPIQYLTLHNHYIGWSSSLYHGLIELDLNFSSGFIYYPTASEFAAISSASPGLRALKLHGLGLRPQEGLDTVEPIL